MNNSLNLKLDDTQLNIINTHNWDWDNPFIFKPGIENTKFIDYQCLNCKTILFDMWGKFRLATHIEQTLTCNEILMRGIIE